MKGGEGPGPFPLLHDGLDKAPANVLDGHQPEADAPLLHGEAVQGAVDVRRQQGDAALPALVDVARYLIGVVQHAGQQGRHVLPGVVALKIGRLIGHHGVGNCVGLVEGVVGKIVNFLVDSLRRGLRDAVCHAAGDVPLQVPVEERLPLLFNIFGFLLAHGPADHVRLPQGIARQVLENLDDLFLIDNAPVSDRQDRLQGGMAVLNELRVLLAGDEPGNGVHGPGTVEGDDGGDVLNVLGLQPHADPCHARGLHLEHAGGFSRRQHLIGLPVRLGDIRQAEVRLVLLQKLHRVLQHRQVPQGQEVHF